MWLHQVTNDSDKIAELTWKSFSLQKINSESGAKWEIIEQTDLSQTRSLMAAVAGEAARRQGPAAFDGFLLKLLYARHGGDTRISLNDEEAIVRVAVEAKLDMGMFTRDFRDPALLGIIAVDHKEAVEKHGVFGTPTFIFESGQSAYLKTFIPPQTEAVETFDYFIKLISDRPYIGEIKRPQPPWPKGAV